MRRLTHLLLATLLLAAPGWTQEEEAEDANPLPSAQAAKKTPVARVALHIGGIAQGDQLSKVQHGNAITQAHHQRQVVLDEADAETVRGQTAEHLGELLGLLRQANRPVAR